CRASADSYPAHARSAPARARGDGASALRSSPGGLAGASPSSISPSSLSAPAAVGLDPLRPGWCRSRQWEIENGQPVPLAAAPADGHDPLVPAEIDTFNDDRRFQHRGPERHLEVLLDHREPPGRLL